jgi:hypothetical protein
MTFKYIREVIAGDVIKLEDGSIAEVKFIHPIKEDARLFAISYFNQTKQVEEFDYQHGAIKCEIVDA